MKNIFFYLNDDSFRITKSDVLFICDDSARSFFLNNQAYAPIIDSVYDDFKKRGITCQVIARPYSKLTGSRANGEPISINRAFLMSRLKKKLLGKKGNFATIELYRRLLKKSGVKLTITLGCNDDLCFAMHRERIFHIELLHGIGYPILPFNWDKKPWFHLPSGILSLDSISTKSFSPLMKHGIEIKTIPHPFLKKFSNPKQLDIPSEWKCQSISTAFDKHILITLQYGLEESGEDSVSLPNELFYSELEKVIRVCLKYKFYFRFHPRQLRRGKYKKQITYIDNICKRLKNCEWKNPSNLPLPVIAMQCDGNITMSSMSCYDVASIGLKSLVLHPNLMDGKIYQNYFKDLEREGYVTKTLPEVSNIIEWISNVKKIEPRLSNLQSEDDWEDAVNWMLWKSGIN